jgi:hypothetical protein
LISNCLIMVGNHLVPKVDLKSLGAELREGSNPSPGTRYPNDSAIT